VEYRRRRRELAGVVLEKYAAGPAGSVSLAAMHHPNHSHTVLGIVDLIDHAVGPSASRVESGKVLAEWLANPVRTVIQGTVDEVDHGW
jgi:hypothetical protein